METQEVGRKIEVEEIRSRFGLTVRSHRIRDINLKIAEVERPDDMVREVYPDAVSEHGDAPVWMITWPAALALAEHLVLQEPVAGATLMELGCGTAAPGIAAALAGARVLCTDYDPIPLELARYNARLNNCSSLQTRLLDWYEPKLPGTFEWIIGSEIVYFEKNFVPLLQVLKRYTADGGRIILSDPDRPQMAPFLEMCERSGFTYRAHHHTVHLPDRSHRIRIVVLEHKH